MAWGECTVAYVELHNSLFYKLETHFILVHRRKEFHYLLISLCSSRGQPIANHASMFCVYFDTVNSRM